MAIESFRAKVFGIERAWPIFHDEVLLALVNLLGSISFMNSMENAQQDLFNGEILSDEEVMYRLTDTGETVSRANNFWMKVQWAPPDAEALVAVCLRGQQIAEKIMNSKDRARFEELSKSLESIASWRLEGEARTKARTSKEANQIYVELYQIARRNGITNSELFK